jgi:SHS2 domain-containing protein
MTDPVRQGETVTAGHRLLEHTADMGIEAWGATLEELFVAAAEGVRRIVFSAQARSRIREEIDVTLEGVDLEELLVDWLGEILFTIEQKRFFPAAFHISEVSRSRLRATISGGPWEDDRCLVHEVKAVTYHRIKVGREGGVWRARVYVDL